MPGKIVLLPPDLTNKIAAGEVVERPASIIKELLENSLDAGGTDIVIELRQGGCGSIKVCDNGEGIDPEDAALAFSRYATSKIYRFDDLYNVHTFGFRGEALPSIASISRVEMVTRKKDSLSGLKIVAEAGEIKEIHETGCPAGTSILVSKIFEPVPVRRKFLKAENTEQGHCIDVITRLALSHPEVAFKVLANDREILNIPAANEAKERLAILLGADFLDQMLEFSGEREGLRIHGFTSMPPLTRANARHIYLFANNRFIRDHLINHAVMTAYRNLIEAKRYPVCVLMMEISPADVDVNVHPAKLEVRFRNPREVYEAVVEALKAPLSGISSLAPADMDQSFPPRTMASQGYGGRVQEALKRYTLSSSALRFARDKPKTVQETEEVSLFNEPLNGPVGQGEMVFSNLNYIGQVSGTYLIFAGSDRMIVLDQHAAHERILFENLKQKSTSPARPPAGQRLLMPEVISLPPRDIAFLREMLPLLEECGFDMEPFGGDTVVLKAIPALLSRWDPKSLVNDLLEEFAERGVATLDGKKEKIFAFLACKGAVKASHSLSPPEVAALCRNLDETPAVLSCPHGRPVFLSFPFQDMEKMFKRR